MRVTTKAKRRSRRRTRRWQSSACNLQIWRIVVALVKAEASFGVFIEFKGSGDQETPVCSKLHLFASTIASH